ncbi:MAG: phosphotransferase [Planctomycetes bacterium]|nr:phosphotransferase [Planctomycetota bacterium]
MRDAAAVAAPSLDGRVPAARDVLLRSWLDGAPLHEARALPRDFFDHLDALVEALHARGVCHNDLHKEQNVVVAADGAPALIDFQLASVHGRRGRLFASRVRDDLRHVAKHRRRYTRDGRGPAGEAEQRGRGSELKRGGVALVWRRTGKPLYNWLTRRVLRTRDGEARRPSSGPWPEWTAPLGAPDALRRRAGS